MVQLDTRVLPELEREGIARDFVRMIQQARKEADFDISDRIMLQYNGSTVLVNEAIQAHQAYIMEQVLAEQMNFADMLPDGAKAEDLGDGQIGFAIEKR